jgi:dihydroorotase
MSVARPLTIVNGQLVLPGARPVPGSLRCSAGRIVALGGAEPRGDDLVVDARGALIAPGLVDLGVFAIDKPAFHFGGITRAAGQPGVLGM